MRIVIDTNVLISAEISISSASRRLRDKIIVDHEITLSNAILQELARTLSDKFGFDGTSVSEIIDSLTRVAEIVEPVIFETQVCRDADDDAILGTAVAGNADCIVTGDSDLLVLERFQDVDIISPAEFAEYEVGRA